MPYNEDIVQRIREFLLGKKAPFSEKRMFGGLCFMVDEKMFCATRTDKVTGDELLMGRVGKDAYESALEENYCTPMEFTGRTMKGYVYVSGDGFRSKSQLDKWLQRCLDYNPTAEPSKKKK